MQSSSVLEAAISILAFEFTGKEAVADHVKPAVFHTPPPVVPIKKV